MESGIQDALWTLQTEVIFFGLSNSPPTFQWFMDHIFAPLKQKYPGLLFIYMDDILIATGEDIELH